MPSNLASDIWGLAGVCTVGEMKQPGICENDKEACHLPGDAIALGLDLQFPSTCLSAITLGCESQSHDDKWSVYWRPPWIQIWRPSDTGVFCYAVRFEEIERQRIRVAESWVSQAILNAYSGLGTDIETHRGIVTWLLERLAGFSGERFVSRLVNGTRERKQVKYSGTVSNLSDVDEIAATLRSQVNQMLKDDW